jgi:hypothetical protein
MLFTDKKCRPAQTGITGPPIRVKKSLIPAPDFFLKKPEII